jgi:hypothetical protein
MICKCGDSGVLCTVLGKNYYYCRTCRVELELEAVKEAPTTFVYHKPETVNSGGGGAHYEHVKDFCPDLQCPYCYDDFLKGIP